MMLPNPSESALAREIRLFREGTSRLLNGYLNRLFDLSPRVARNRFWSLVILFLISGFLFSLIYYPPALWVMYLQDFFLYLFNSAYRSTYVGNPLANLIGFALKVFFDPRNLRFIPLLLAPYFISLQFAAIYLADIFNLEDVSIARRHITEVALGGSDETIRITKGEIAEESKNSSNYLIGGPGKVIVDLDSAALFEKPDGTPHVIGPTGREPGGKATIEGFERFREAIDLREHFIELRDLDEKSQSVSSRSKDGIPISATDVRFAFSIDRDGKIPTQDFPYPFSVKAVGNLVYKAVSQVTIEQENPSKYNFLWINNMTSLIRGELAGFMNQRNLTEYLASFGRPEVETIKQREQAFGLDAQNLLPTNEPPADPPGIPSVPEFVPRHEISGIFNEFQSKFATTAHNRGVELRWIGIGTWKSPVEKIISDHLEAWKMIRENSGSGNTDSMNSLNSRTSLVRVMGLIQEIPLASYQQASNRTEQYTLIMFGVVVDYRKLLIQARDSWVQRGENPPHEVEEAIRILDRILFRVQQDEVPPEEVISPEDGMPPAGEGIDIPGPAAIAYQELVRLVGGDEATANRLIEQKRGQFPMDSREILIERVIEDLNRDRRG